jgi:hypothetical protein
MKTNLSWLLALTLVLSGCLGTRITSSWKDPATAPRPYGRIMVAGIIREADRSIREHMEDHLVNDLRAQGFNAGSVYREYGPKAFEQLNEEQTRARLKKDGVEAVLTIVLLDKERERYYVPGQVRFTPYDTYHRHLWGYSQSIYARIQSPGYYRTTTRYFWESNLYDLQTNTLVCSVQTQSFQPASAESLAHEYGKLIVEHLIRNKVLVREAPATVKLY